MSEYIKPTGTRGMWFLDIQALTGMTLATMLSKNKNQIVLTDVEISCLQKSLNRHVQSLAEARATK